MHLYNYLINQGIKVGDELMRYRSDRLGSRGTSKGNDWHEAFDQYCDRLEDLEDNNACLTLWFKCSKYQRTLKYYVPSNQSNVEKPEAIFKSGWKDDYRKLTQTTRYAKKGDYNLYKFLLEEGIKQDGIAKDADKLMSFQVYGDEEVFSTDATKEWFAKFRDAYARAKTLKRYLVLTFKCPADQDITANVVRKNMHGYFVVAPPKGQAQQLGAFEGRFVEYLPLWLENIGVEKDDMLTHFTRQKTACKGNDVPSSGSEKLKKQQDEKMKLLRTAADAQKILTMKFYRLKKIVYTGAIETAPKLFHTSTAGQIRTNRRKISSSKVGKIVAGSIEDKLFKYLVENGIKDDGTYELVRFQSDKDVKMETARHDQVWQDKLTCEDELTLWFRCEKDIQKYVDHQVVLLDRYNAAQKGASTSARRLIALADRFQRVRDYQAGNL